jgi:hypothetical protein
LCELAKKYDLRIIEDCAQAHGAKIGDQFVGTFGDIGVFSLNVTRFSSFFNISPMEASFKNKDKHYMMSKIRFLWRREENNSCNSSNEQVI